MIYMLHIRKTGGTAVKAAFADVPWFIGYSHDMAIERVPSDGKILFAVRDPVERVTSAFYDRLREGKPGYDCPRLAQELGVFDVYQSITTIAEGLWSPDAPARARAAAALAAMDHTSCRYWDWLRSREVLAQLAERILYVLFTPTLQVDINSALSRVGKPSVNLSTDPTRAHVAPAEHRHAIPGHYRQALAKHYAADYDCLRAIVEVLPHDSISPALLAWYGARGHDA